MSSGFVTESEIKEAKRVRQEEWEKVRNKDDPVEAPEPCIDHRSLFDRLQEQKQKKDLEYEETHKLKNMIRGLDDDEVDFLDLVDKNKLEAEKQQKLEELKELQEFRQKSATANPIDLKEKLSAELNGTKNKVKSPVVVSRLSQKSILAGVVRKRSSSEANGSEINSNKKLKDDAEGESKTNTIFTKPQENTNSTRSIAILPKANPAAMNALQCVAILPGLGYYKDSSDSDDSSDPETPIKYDLVGKKIEKKEDE